MMDYTQQDLVSQFEKIYDTYAERLLSFVFYKVGDKVITEDIVSETFSKIWEKMSRGDVIVYDRAFIYFIARGLVIDYYRKNKHREWISIEDVANVLIAEGSVSARIDVMHDYEKVIQALRCLKTEYSDILTLHYIEDFSIHEISSMLQVHENALRVRLHRALKMLRKYLHYEK